MLDACTGNPSSTSRYETEENEGKPKVFASIEVPAHQLDELPREREELEERGKRVGSKGIHDR